MVTEITFLNDFEDWDILADLLRSLIYMKLDLGIEIAKKYTYGGYNTFTWKPRTQEN